MFDNLINNFDDGFNFKTLNKLKYIYVTSNNISSLKKREKGHYKKKNFLRN